MWEFLNTKYKKKYSYKPLGSFIMLNKRESVSITKHGLLDDLWFTNCISNSFQRQQFKY